MSTDTMSSEDTISERPTWNSGGEFLMSCIAMSIGLGNVWRFPFTAYENGGGAFLLPYIVCLFLVGKPVYYLETVIGQFSSKQPVELYAHLAPILKGIGAGQILGVSGVGTYYYFPWAHCKPEWESDMSECVSVGKAAKNRSIQSISSSELWYTNAVLKQTTDINNGIGLPDLQLSIFLLVTWSVLFLITIKGIRSSGKAAYFLALFPCVIMCTLLIRTVTLEGSVNGILYFLKPQWKMLVEPKVWYNAITQCFFSLAIASGNLVMYASYNCFTHNVYRDAMIVTTIDTITSLISGITIFGVLGNLAHTLKVEVNDVVSGGGAKLAFVSYPDAISRFKHVPWLFAILFFAMLFVLGIGSLIGTNVCALSAIKDVYPMVEDWYVSAAICLVGFLFGLVYVTPGGEFVLVTVDYFLGTFLPFALVILEMLAICWWYGVENVCLDIEFMCERRVGSYWRICWSLITPLILIAVFVYCLLSMQPLKNGKYEVPKMLMMVGWSLFALGILQPVLHWIIFLFTNRKMGFKQAVRESLSFKSWGPQNSYLRADWRQFKVKRLEEVTSTNKSWFVRKIKFLLSMR
ncbi:sodium-dependent nutrient amino acid transporter 1-like isoform X2 [Photinus pyralis]|uniref:sodium-dependent nutrient amino acid transporter 1-like isoform X2 n=1 Tax=Photinus pyralis TaxID=7054 RepID=UPI00126725A1|nr:sodium-dependent nutrient amino acid transporter 1-like isoform X2 [Photinus pyralis]